MDVRWLKKARRKRRRTGLGIVVLLVLVICGVFLYGRVLLEEEAAGVNARYEAALERYEAETRRESELAELKIYTQTKKFVEDMAREIYGLVYENEIVFVPEE